METFKYDEWKRDLAKTQQLIRSLKDILREAHQPRKYSGGWQKNAEGKFCRWYGCTESDLLAAKFEATQLYAIRAHQRGRVHVRGMTWEQQNELIGAPGCTPDAHKKKAA